MNELTQAVLDYFRQISAIPRQSGNEKGMQDYLVDFAKKRNLPFYQDEFYNVIIYKKTADVEPIILQAHTDMVYVTKTNPYKAKQRKGIKLIEKNNWLYAKDTTLGADDGIGVALILAILDLDIPCNIEAVFTATEETTMQGAYNLDVSQLKSKKLICLDGFEGNAVVVSSASFTDFLVEFDNGTTNLPIQDYHYYNIEINGLLGGHSGFDIDKKRGNSHQLMSELLKRLPDAILGRMVGGYQYNVIPTNSMVVIATTADETTVKAVVEAFVKEKSKLSPLFRISTTPIERPIKPLKNSENLLNFLTEFNYGVLQKDDQNNVVVSQNLSEINTDKGTIKIGLRSNLKHEWDVMVADLQALCEKHHLGWKIMDRQPEFNTLHNSSLLADLQRANPDAKKIKMHIGVECGIFQSHMPGLDAVIISPTIIGAHSVSEKLDLNSVELTANWLKAYLTQN